LKNRIFKWCLRGFSFVAFYHGLKQSFLALNGLSEGKSLISVNDFLTFQITTSEWLPICALSFISLITKLPMSALTFFEVIINADSETAMAEIAAQHIEN